MPPPPGWIELNFDGVFNELNGKASIGGPIQDPYGNMVTAFIGEVRASHPLETKLLAPQRGLSHVTELDDSSIQIEGTVLHSSLLFIL